MYSLLLTLHMLWLGHIWTRVLAFLSHLLPVVCWLYCKIQWHLWCLGCFPTLRRKCRSFGYALDVSTKSSQYMGVSSVGQTTAEHCQAILPMTCHHRAHQRGSLYVIFFSHQELLLQCPETPAVLPIQCKPCPQLCSKVLCNALYIHECPSLLFLPAFLPKQLFVHH